MILGVSILQRKCHTWEEAEVGWSSWWLLKWQWLYLFVEAAEVSVLPHAAQDLGRRLHHFRTMSGNSAQTKCRTYKARLSFVGRWTKAVSVVNKVMGSLAVSAWCDLPIHKLCRTVSDSWLMPCVRVCVCRLDWHLHISDIELDFFKSNRKF